MLINAFINSNASSSRADVFDLFIYLFISRIFAITPGIILSSELSSPDRFQVKDTSRAVALNISKNNIYHSLSLARERGFIKRAGRWQEEMDGVLFPA